MLDVIIHINHCVCICCAYIYINRCCEAIFLRILSTFYQLIPVSLNVRPFHFTQVVALTLVNTHIDICTEVIDCPHKSLILPLQQTFNKTLLQLSTHCDSAINFRPVLLNLFDPLHPFKIQFSAIHPHHDKPLYYRILKLGNNDIGCIL